MDTIYLHDGYTASGYVKAVPGLHGAVRFQFRPLMVSERSAWLVLAEKAEKSSPGGSDKETARIVATRIKSWDVKDKDGNAAPISPESVLRLQPRLYQRVVGIVAGSEPTDLDEQAPQGDDLAAQAEAVFFPATELQAQQQKN